MSEACRQSFCPLCEALVRQGIGTMLGHDVDSGKTLLRDLALIVALM